MQSSLGTGMSVDSSAAGRSAALYVQQRCDVNRDRSRAGRHKARSPEIVTGAQRNSFQRAGQGIQTARERIRRGIELGRHLAAPTPARRALLFGNRIAKNTLVMGW